MAVQGITSRGRVAGGMTPLDRGFGQRSARALGRALEEQATVPPELWGLWRRDLLETDGGIDRTTRVFWLQTPVWFADIRIPRERRLSGGGRSLVEYPAEGLSALARQGGFAGWTSCASIADGFCTWHRDIDFQPPGGTPDEAHLRLEGDTLVEEGVHERYREVWSRVEGGFGDWIAHRVTAPGTPPRGASRTYLVTAGDWFVFARGRAEPLEHAPSLSSLIARRHLGRGATLDLLHFEISLGRRRGGAMPWQVVLSTLPYREGWPLDELVTPTGGG